MKKSIILIFLILASIVTVVNAQMIVLSVTVDNSHQFVVNGTVSDNTLDGYSIVSSDISESDTIKDGKFTFKGTIQPDHRYWDSTYSGYSIVVFASNKKEAKDLTLELFIESGIITVERSNTYPYRYIARGTQWNNEFAFYFQGKENYTDVFKRHNNDLIGKYILGSVYAQRYGFKHITFNELWLLIGDELKDDLSLKLMAEQHENIKKTAVGLPFADFATIKIDPSFKLKLKRKHKFIIDKTNYAEINLSNYVGKGKWVLMDLSTMNHLGYTNNLRYGHNFNPNNPHLKSLKSAYNRFKDKGVVVLSAILEDAYWVTLHPTKALRYKECVKGKKALDIQWEVLMCGSDPIKLYALYGLKNSIMYSLYEGFRSETILLAPDGTIAARYLNDDNILETIAKKLTESKSNEKRTIP